MHLGTIPYGPTRATRLSYVRGGRVDCAMMFFMQPPPDAFTVKIMPKPTDVEGLADVLIGSLGLAGVLVLAGVLLALLFAGGLFVFRLKFGDPFPSASDHEPGANSQRGSITR